MLVTFEHFIYSKFHLAQFIYSKFKCNLLYFTFIFPMAHLLLVEDNKTIGQNIVTYLEHDGHTVDWYKDGAEGKDRALQYVYDCIVLDVMLPWLDGIELLQQLRVKKQTPVIMTTAKWQIDDKQEAFDLGADDYLVKPFALEELSMRIKALLKRSESRDIYQIGDIQVDLENKTVVRAGHDVHLTMKEFLIVSYLLEYNGRAVLEIRYSRICAMRRCALWAWW